LIEYLEFPLDNLINLISGKFEGGTYEQEAAVGPDFFDVWLPIVPVYENVIVLVKGRAREAHLERVRFIRIRNVFLPFVFFPADYLLKLLVCEMRGGRPKV
jgi:hypothetical protein